MTRPNGVATNYTYDNLSHLLSVLHQLSGSTIDGATYTVDNAGNRTSKTDNHTGMTSNYTYDAIYELTQVTGGTSESYTYDPVGNRLSSLGVSPYQYNPSNEMVSTPDGLYVYDNNGNLTSKTDSTGTTNYSWDFENRLTQAALPGSSGTVTFRYDPFGRRVQKAFTQAGTTTTTNYSYDGDDSIEEVDPSGNLLAKYARTTNIDEPLAESRSGTASYYEADGLNSVTSLTTGAGSLAQSYTFDSFGKLIGSSGSVINPFLYSGREFDSETGLYYYRARYYDPNSGRFLSEDPIQFESNDLNLYRYALGSPVNLGDPYGQDAGAIAAGASVSVTTTVTVVSIEGTSTYGPVLPLIAGGSGAGAEAGPIGALAGIIAVTGAYDAHELHLLCIAYGLCADNNPNPNPGPTPGNSSPSNSNSTAQCKRGRWHCTAKCHINNFSGRPNIPDFVFGEGWGNSEAEATNAAQKDANNNIKKLGRGIYKRHCDFKCEKR